MLTAGADVGVAVGAEVAVATGVGVAVAAAVAVAGAGVTAGTGAASPPLSSITVFQTMKAMIATAMMAS